MKIIADNPLYIGTLVHCYMLNESIVILGMAGLFCRFYSMVDDNPVSKLCRPWSDATLCGVWFGSALFAYSLLRGSR